MFNYQLWLSIKQVFKQIINKNDFLRNFFKILPKLLFKKFFQTS